MTPVCFFKGWALAGPCDGALIRAHLIPRQLLKREFPQGVALYVVVGGDRKWRRWRHGDPFGEAYRSLADLIADEHSWIPCCGGPMGCSGHHGQLDYSKKLRIPRDRLPVKVEAFAEALGLGWYLDRTYGEAASAA